MNKNILPKHLKIGDKAIIISPSGNIDNKYIDDAKLVLEGWGLQVSIAPHAYACFGRYAGTVEERLSDLQSAMDDTEIKLILCSRGGYGVVQLLEKINFEKIKQHPKWLVGYSDITALHLALLHQGIACIHAPMAQHLSEDTTSPASLYLKNTLFGKQQQYELDTQPLNRLGKTEGYLFGGNLAVMTALAGSDYMQIPENGILFVEDIAESAYKIDRMMWNLRLSGVFSKLSGLIVGQFADCDEDPQMQASIYQNISKLVEDYNFPIIFDFPVGHVIENYPLIQGEMYKMEVDSIKSRLFQIRQTPIKG